MALKLTNCDYSPAVLEKIVKLDTVVKSNEVASRALDVAAELKISARHVGRLAAQVGRELASSQAELVQRFRQRESPRSVSPPPRVAVVEGDGGRLRTRAMGRGRGVHDPHWREDKIAALFRMESEVRASDPQPEPPKCFLSRPYVEKLMRELHGHGVGVFDNDALFPGLTALLPAAAAAQTAVVDPAPDWRPKRLVRTCVGTRADSEDFGLMVAAEAWERRFFEAPRGAFLGDGQKYNWTLHKTHFAEFVPILDLIHPQTYLWTASRVICRESDLAWQQYSFWLREVWQGRVTGVLDELRAALDRLDATSPTTVPTPDVRLAESPPTASSPPKTPRDSPKTPRDLLAATITYLENNQSRMDYPRYRKQGLPITSSLVESLVKEFNYRVKGTEKYWNEDAGTEPILHLMAAALSEDDRLHKHMINRPGEPRRPYRRAKLMAG